MGFRQCIRNCPRLCLYCVFLLIYLPLSVPALLQPSIYDLLQAKGLPIGILPKGITDFEIDSDTGRFGINLTQPCNAKFENQVHYDFNITGVLSYGEIGEISGMEQQELFLWFPVKRIRVDVPSSGLIHFDVGVVDKQFSLSLFESPRDCTAVDPTLSLPSKNQPENILAGVEHAERAI